MLAASQRSTASGARIFQILDREPSDRGPPRTRPGLPDGGGRVTLRGAGLTFEGTTHPRPPPTSVSTCRPARRWHWSARWDRESRRWSSCSRLYDVTTGSVEIEGADVRSVDLVSLRNAIAVVNDDPFLFSATVLENIAYARPEATREEVERAAAPRRPPASSSDCQRATTPAIGERGLTLSGGQRQRMAIARAILADPRILILDDATSSVDASTEQEIKRGARRAARRPHDLRDRPPAVDDRAGRPDRRARARAAGRRRLARRAARTLRAVSRDRREGHARPGVPDPQAAEVAGL